MTAAARLHAGVATLGGRDQQESCAHLVAGLARNRQMTADTRRASNFMCSTVLKRTGGVLLATGIVGGVVTFIWLAMIWRYLAPMAAIAVLAGGLLLRGGPRTALWLRSLAVLLLAAGITALLAAALFQPLDLTLTEIRLDPGDFALAAAIAAIVLVALLWVSLELGRPAVRDEIAAAGIRRWDVRLPAQAGAGIVVVIGALLWMMLHGQTADLATSLAQQQLGPEYRYHLSWISSDSNGRFTSVRGVVTAWNHKEIKHILLHWETR